MTKLIFNILIAISFITGVYLPGKKSTKATVPVLLKNTTVKGTSAGLIILTDNPAGDIQNTRKAEAIYKAGKEVSKGPLVK